jgi:hypothetical protein
MVERQLPKQSLVNILIQCLRAFLEEQKRARHRLGTRIDFVELRA